MKISMLHLTGCSLSALALKEVEYVPKLIDIKSKEGQQKNLDEYRKINPFLQVPALVVNNEVLIESMAIIEYIDEVFTSGRPIFPKDPTARAKARGIAHSITSGIHPIQNNKVRAKVKEMTDSGKATMLLTCTDIVNTSDLKFYLVQIGL